MSNAAMNYVDQHAGPDMASGMFFVLFRLADRGSDHSGEDWTCFPSIDDLVKGTRLSRSAVERHLQGLVMEGWISRKRQKRADGQLGRYDYWIHRTAERRAALKAAREAIREAGEKLSEMVADLDHPCCKTQHGPCGDLEPAMLQNGAGPCGESPHQEEPSNEPSRDNPQTARAREPGDQGFEALADLWPESGLKRTNWGEARAAFAWAAGIETVERLAAAARACAADPDVAKGDYGWPGLQVWLREERWRAWLPKAAPAVAAAAAVERAVWPGPAAVRQAVAERMSEAFAAAYLDKSGWDEADQAVRPWSTAAQTNLRLLWRELRDIGVSIGALKASGGKT